MPDGASAMQDGVGQREPVVRRDERCRRHSHELLHSKLTLIAAANDNLRSHSEAATRALQAKQRQMDDSNDSFRSVQLSKSKHQTRNIHFAGEYTPTLCVSWSRSRLTTTMQSSRSRALPTHAPVRSALTCRAAAGVPARERGEQAALRHVEPDGGKAAGGWRPDVARAA